MGTVEYAVKVVAVCGVVALLSYTAGYTSGPYTYSAYDYLAKSLAGVVAKVKSLERRVARLERTVYSGRSGGTYCVVTASWLRVRKGPSIKSPVGGLLGRGIMVQVVGSEGNWYRTPFGYISKKYCEVVKR